MKKILIIISILLLSLFIACKPEFLQNDVEKAMRSPLHNPTSLEHCEEIDLKMILDDYVSYAGSGCKHFKEFGDDGQPLQLHQNTAPLYAFYENREGYPPMLVGDLATRKQEYQERYGFSDDALYYDVCKRVLNDKVIQQKEQCIQRVQSGTTNS
ncbi:hypothetical protein GOV04_02965 [Candidatus Woesearchaeota archaeon]|nr:hypothetical protein [Candidatus Woesearchaeota archaeon]